MEIHHVRREAPRGTAFFEHPEKWDDRREHYRHVATVTVRRPAEEETGRLLEDAWRELQNGVRGPENASAECHVQRRRSTSVGDVMILYPSAAGDEADPIPFEVGTIGFRRITEENPDPSVGDRNPRPIGEMGPSTSG